MMGRKRRYGIRPWLIEDKTGVWTYSERAAEAARRKAAQQAAASAALAEMEAWIAAIVDDPELTAQQKRTRLRVLQPSGYSPRERTMIAEAEEALMS
jgi:hypothetical protein